MTNQIKKAEQVTIRAHANQYRKGSRVPYYTHPFAVAQIVSKYTNEECIVVAALFHDILEDVPSEVYSEQQMRDEFGDLVVSIVKNVSENKRADDEQTKPWRARKEYYLHHLRILEDIPALIVSAADKIHNISCMLEDYSAFGNELWLRFNAPKADQLWNYQSILDILKDKDIPQGMKEQLEELVDKLEAICSNE